jgi:uncharacterized membrane protein
MRNQLRYSKIVGLIIFTLIFAIVVTLSFLSYTPAHFVNQSGFLIFAVTHHIWIMAAMVIISILFGVFWSRILYRQLEKKQSVSRNVMDIVLLFLNSEERKILHFLVENKGKTTQAEIARIASMNKVKAFRSLKKMKEKNIIEIEPHGKVRFVILKEDILQLLLDENNTN